MTLLLAHVMSARLVERWSRLAPCGMKKDGSSFPIRIEKSTQSSQKAVLGTALEGSYFYLFTGPRPIQDGSWDAFLKISSWQGYAGH